ncbi:MAG: glycosyltransferase family 2 protein [Promethearchaeota archaeon]
MLKNKPYFSIIILSYNLADYIEEAIKSVIEQTYPNWELIIVDDASSDDSIKKINNFLIPDKIRLLKNKKNQGVAKSLIKGIKSARYEIIGILDADDMLHKNALEIIANEYVKNINIGVIYSTHWICDKKLNKIKIANWIGEQEGNITHLHDFKVSHFKTFLKKVYFQTKGINPNLTKCYDTDLIYKLEEVTNFKFINYPLYFYRIHDKNVSNKNKIGQRLDNYRAKLDAFKRRFNSNFPNISINDLYFDYYLITFTKIIKFFQIVRDYMRLYQLIKVFLPLFLRLPINNRKKILNLKKKYFFWF